MTPLRPGGRALSFGSLNLDVAFQVPRIVRPGETLRSLGRATHPGGKGLNQALALARAGVVTAMAGAVGPDGQDLIDLLRSNGVDVTGVRMSSEPTGSALIQVDPEGANCIIVDRAANGTLTPEQIDQTLARTTAGDVLVLQNEVNLVAELAEAGHARGLTVAFNPSPVDADALRVDLGNVDILITNEDEATALTGASSAEAAIDTACTQLPHLIMVVTRGAHGSLAGHGTSRLLCPAVPTKVVDTTGAGDTFTGYFLASLMFGDSLSAALERASRAASLAVGRAGAASSIPTAAEVARHRDGR